MTLSIEQRQEIGSILGSYGANKRGIISSFQSNPPMVKAQIMGGGSSATSNFSETGWIPYKSFATGLGGRGWAVVAPPQVGQQVLLVCEECDGQNYSAWGGYFSDLDPAPQGANPGEILFAHQSGSFVRLMSDGTISITAKQLSINGSVDVSGTVSASDFTTTSRISLALHHHISESAGTQTSSPLAEQ